LKAESKDDKIVYRYTASPENIHETGTKLENAEKDAEKTETGNKEKIRMQRKIIT
jgi:hypothetical protein